MDDRIKAIRISVVSNTLLTVLKLAVGIGMGSMGVVAEGVHSGLDLVASLVTFLSVREAVKPADDVHSYGHGKFENLAGLVEAGLILVAAVFIVFGSVQKLVIGAPVTDLGLGVVVMACSMLVNWFVSGRLLVAGKRLDSPALAADGRHLRTDVFTSAGVFIGLVLIYLTGWDAFDPIMGLLVSALILKIAYDLSRDALQGFLDVRLPPEEGKLIQEVLAANAKSYINYHALRTRRSGSRRLVDLHLVVPKDHPIGQVHDLCDQIEQELTSRLPGCEALIHIEPCKLDCPDCQLAHSATAKTEFVCRSSGCSHCRKN
ncbi:MAG: cation diffusion facilitator family transporter [Peptococcaceae bacterium]|jgi:cation diffusion facilitator family transporter|nr:cation diffusion facilitator family transporter [Peptococcaceae bacterium]